MSRQIVHDHDIAGLEFRHQYLFHISAEGWPMHRAIEQHGAARPLSRNPAVKVVVFQCP